MQLAAPWFPQHWFRESDGDTPTPDVHDRIRFRWLVVALQATSILVTWSLWRVRDDPDPPNLPLFGFIQFDIGWILLASLVVVLVRPVIGMALHTALLALAIGMDQMRIQPEFISLTFLLWGTLPYAGTSLICRAHLFSLWLFAGIHKLLSPGYVLGEGRAMCQAMLPFHGDTFASTLAVFVALCEVLLAGLLILPRTRKAASWLACIMHVGILFALVIRPWNAAVWPWNIALAVSGFSLFYFWHSNLWDSVRQSSRIFQIAALLLVLSPIGFYFGIVDAYFAHCLYSSNTPRAVPENGAIEETQLQIEKTNTKRDTLSHLTMERRFFWVPFPPADRLYDAYFMRVAKSGDGLIITYPQWWGQHNDESRHVRVLSFDEGVRTAVGQMRDRKRVGHWIFWTPDNEKEEEGSYRDGLRHGPWTAWYKSGEKSMIGTYRDGKAHGKWTHWYADGSKEAEGMYVDDEMDGKWIMSLEDGRVMEVHYDRGQVISKKQLSSNRNDR